MKLKYQYLLLTLLLLPWSYLQANNPQYQFEIIIFEYKNQTPTENEVWPDNPGTPAEPEQALAVFSDDEKILLNPSNGFQVVSEEQYLLKKEAYAIKRSTARKLLIHTGWIQPMLPREQAIPVVLKLGKPLTIQVPDPSYQGDSLIQATPANSNTPPAAARETPVSEATQSDLTDSRTNPDTLQTIAPDIPMINQDVKQLEGTLTISISRYLHIWSDLIFRRPLDTPALVNPAQDYATVSTFRFVDHRRMRSRELHYLDNPVFGMLIYAIPYEQKPTEEEPSVSN